ncbi:hypothetical protein K2173_022717 [Erythroxylum novogranatense]|uniref:Uncharacterized protein n=1 Tax=Erythroxylum novogranatense TaxID=1862640 RepID=A0AAV8TNS9_9ROSI|nr:hypothetical protein K2173_022717 [Erythroxylum novogranatense]
MNAQTERGTGQVGVYKPPNRHPRIFVEQNGMFETVVDANRQSLVEWLNFMVPHLNLRPGATNQELGTCLMDGTVLCSILNKLHPGLIEMKTNCEPGTATLEKFLAAMDEMGLTRFVIADIQQGYMVPVLQCLGMLKARFEDKKQRNSSQFSEGIDCTQGEANSAMHEKEIPRNFSDNKNQHRLHGSVVSDPSMDLRLETGCDSSVAFLLKQGLYSDLSDAENLELIKSNGLNNSSTRTLFGLLDKLLDESIERKNGHVHHQMAYVLRKVVQVVEHRVSAQAENLQNQNNLLKVRAEKYQSRIQVLETLAAGATEEIGVLLSQLQQIKIEKTKLVEKEKLEEFDLLRLKEEKKNSDIENSTLKLELEMTKKAHEERFLLLQVQARETKLELEKKLKELESFLVDSRNKVEELESFSQSKSQRWKKKEGTYKNFINNHCKALEGLRAASESIKHEVLETKRNYLEEFYSLGMKLKGLADATKNYHYVLAENRRLYNEVQDLKGNIRVYCRIRPFLPGQCKKQTTIEFIGDNGELVVSNPSRQGKDTHRLFKFNKVFGPATSQEDVFLDTQPLIRSVLDGYNVCIFAYGQTGSGKTYTMSGPKILSEEDWGVNYRALHDLFQISLSRKSSVAYEVGVQMVEIYNEQVRDLLTSDGIQKRLGIWNTTQPNGLAVPDASMHSVTSTADVLELMNIGLMNRAVGATALNERSSRSHSILTVHVRGTDLGSGALLRGNLHLVDLAGSERVDRSEATGDRLKEAQHINKSLSALGDVIFALAQKSSHVPYRNSKLTQVLQTSLGGQAKTLMFVQLNPDVESYSETISTLKFAERVSGVELGAARSHKEGRDIRELMEQVSYLKDTIAKKDEEIERLQQLRISANGVKYGNSLRCESISPIRRSAATPRQSPRLPKGKDSGSFEKVVSEMDNRSDCSERRSEFGSTQSMDGFRRPKERLLQSKSMVELRQQEECVPQSKPSGTDIGQSSKDDIELVGFGNVDSDERLSDISDSGLSMGTETDGSLGSAVEFTLFPECTKPAEGAKHAKSLNSTQVSKHPESLSSTEAAKQEKVEKLENPSFASKLPKPPQQGLTQLRLSRLSFSRSSTPKVSSSVSASRRSSAANSSATKSQKRWH